MRWLQRMPGRKNSNDNYFAGALVLIGLMIIALVLGWYGLQIVKESITNTTTTPAPTPLPTSLPGNETQTTASPQQTNTSTTS
ncbi:MAG: hypothetical protein J7L55_04575 [Desulfurococcales archaeon]|nr:hypothetical protein [Desulfurococcales archaeon]